MARKEFPKAIKVAVIRRSTTNGVTYCEECHGIAKGFHIDHINPDALTGQPTIENAMLLCLPCHAEKTKLDVANIAKAKRVEARHLGAATPAGNIARRPTEPAPAQKRASRPMTKTCAGMPALQRRFTNVCQ